ncbi:MerR family transcriptional regulator [Nitrospira sp. Nam80]
MRIGQVAKVLGVSKDLLRKFEQRGLIADHRDLNGHRRYTDEDLAAIRRVLFGSPERVSGHNPKIGTALQ